MSSNYVLFIMAFVSLIAVINVIYINNLKKRLKIELESQRFILKSITELISGIGTSANHLYALTDIALEKERELLDKDLVNQYSKSQKEFFETVDKNIRLIQEMLSKPITLDECSCESETEHDDCPDCEASFTERARQMSEEENVKQESKQEVNVNKAEESNICAVQETKNEVAEPCAECEHADAISEPKEEKCEMLTKVKEALAKKSHVPGQSDGNEHSEANVKFDGVIYPVASKEFFELLGSNLPKKEILPYITDFIEKTVVLQKNKGVVADHIAAYLALRVHDISDAQSLGDQRDAVLKTYNRLLGFMYSISSNKIISHSTDKSMKLKTAIHKQYRYSYRLVFKAK